MTDSRDYARPIRVTRDFVGEHMNRSELVAIVASEGGFRKGDAEKAVNSLLTAITDALKRGDEVRLTGFGTFTVASRAAGQARHPRTGEPVIVAASRQPKFKAAKHSRKHSRTL
jgi:DNA-binding protein HU-beta